MSSLAGEGITSTVEDDSGERNRGDDINPMEEAGDPRPSNIAYDDDDNGPPGDPDMDAHIQNTDEQGMLCVDPPDICDPRLDHSLLGQAVGLVAEGDYQLPAGGIHDLLPDATQAGGSLIADFIPSFSTFIVCYCTVLAALILSSTTDA